MSRRIVAAPVSGYGGDHLAGHQAGAERSEAPWARASAPVRAVKTIACAERLLSLHDPEADHHARRVRACAERRVRCGSRWCASCRARAAVQRRRAIERALRALPPDHHVVLLTYGVGCDAVADGLDVVVGGLARVRRAPGSPVLLGGAGQVECTPSAGSGAAWNVHAHVLAWSAGRVTASHVRAMRAAWLSLASAAGVAGALHVRQIGRRWAGASRSFRAGGVLLHEAAIGRLALAGRRHAPAARSRAAGPPARRRLPARVIP